MAGGKSKFSACKPHMLPAEAQAVQCRVALSVDNFLNQAMRPTNVISLSDLLSANSMRA